MLRKTIDLSQYQREKHADYDDQIGSIEKVRGKLEIVLQTLVAQKAEVERRFLEERKHLEEELEARTSRIEKLEQRIRKLQGENQQVKYQYEQRVSLMSILKNQNALISKEFAKEKEQIKQTVQTLLEENRQLKDALIEAHFKERRKHQVRSPEAVLGDFYGPKFYSSKELGKWDQAKKQSRNWRSPLKTEVHGQSEFQDSNISKSSIAAILQGQNREFKESRMTRIKGRSGTHFQGLQKMSTRTHMSRLRSGDPE